MQRCDEIFRQICWLEQRFWPEVDGMGEDNELNAPAHMGTMGTNLNNGINDNAMNSNRMSGQNVNNGPISRGRINSNANNNTGSNVNGPLGAQVNRQSMTGSMMGGQDISGQEMSGSAMSGDDGIPSNDDGKANFMFPNIALEGQGS